MAVGVHRRGDVGVAQGWRRSWTRIRGSPALSNIGLKDLVLRFDGFMGVLVRVANTSPSSSHSPMYFSSSSCRLRWALKRYLSMVSSKE